MESFKEFADFDLSLDQIAEELKEEKIPVQHASDSVAKVLGTKGAVRFIMHLKPGAEKHTSWDNINNALKKQGVKQQHIVKIATHVKPAQFKEGAEIDEAKDSVERDASGKLKSWKHEGDWRKSTGSGTITDKSGAKHTPYSRARDMARAAIKKTLAKEETRQIDELKKSTIASYAKKSAAELPKHQANATLKHTGPIANAHAGKHPKTGESPIQWDDRKVKNRGAGIARAVDKLAKEEVQVDEAIKGWKHAHSDIAKSRAAASDASKSVHLHVLTKAGKESGMHDARKSFSSVADAEKHHENIHKLNPGKSYKHNLYVDGKLVKTLGESVDKCNVCGQTPCNCTYITEEIHRIGVTVSDPNHSMASQRKEKVQKFVRITGGSHSEAQDRAKKHYAKKGYKVHDTWHAGMVKEEVNLDEAVSSDSKSRYEYTNGKKPSGTGHWMFSTVHPREHDVKKHKDQTVSVHGTFSDASKKAAAHFKEKGHKGEIHVLS